MKPGTLYNVYTCTCTYTCKSDSDFSKIEKCVYVVRGEGGWFVYVTGLGSFLLFRSFCMLPASVLYTCILMYMYI